MLVLTEMNCGVEAYHVAAVRVQVLPVSQQTQITGSCGDKKKLKNMYIRRSINESCTSKIG
jgi:hypothetical protein